MYLVLHLEYSLELLYLLHHGINVFLDCRNNVTNTLAITLKPNLGMKGV